MLESLKPHAETNGWAAGDLSKEFGEFEYRTMRDPVLTTATRIDGRDLVTVRSISVKPVFCRGTHGSAMFTRGRRRSSW